MVGKHSKEVWLKTQLKDPNHLELDGYVNGGLGAGRDRKGRRGDDSFGQSELRPIIFQDWLI